MSRKVGLATAPVNHKRLQYKHKLKEGSKEAQEICVGVGMQGVGAEPRGGLELSSGQGSQPEGLYIANEWHSACVLHSQLHTARSLC